jgi:hypothetical protein
MPPNEKGSMLWSPRTEIYSTNTTSKARRIAIVVLSTTSWPRIQREVSAVVQAANGAAPGSCVEVEFPLIG